MNSYKVIFSFRNGATGEIMLKAQSDKVAFATAFKLFRDFDDYEWDIQKI